MNQLCVDKCSFTITGLWINTLDLKMLLALTIEWSLYTSHLCQNLCEDFFSISRDP